MSAGREAGRRALLAWAALFLALGMPLSAQNPGEGTLTGRFVLPTTGQGVSDGTLSLVLSQSAIVPGSYQVVAQQVSCYTSTDGSVVGLPNPLYLPRVTAITGVGTLPAGTYFVRTTYEKASGETLPGPESNVMLSATGELLIAAPPSQPAEAAGWNIYIGTAGDKVKLQQSGWDFAAPYTQSQPLNAASSAPPVANSTACQVAFNDATLPTDTYYTATLSDSSGDLIAGFPQMWYLTLPSVSVDTLTPLSTPPRLSLPMPVLANSSQPQSVASALQMNGNPIYGVANLGSGMLSGYVAGILGAGTFDEWTPRYAIRIVGISLHASTPGSGGTSGATLTLYEDSPSGPGCAFSSLLPGATAYSTATMGSGSCYFAAGVPIVAQITADDHTTAPSAVNWHIEYAAGTP